ncbi:DUF853 family protein [Elizabethkingia argentiflava]|uniref:DUF853 family protein n=1 Tax=Elizabethkingia argenteiflava TaxID=2681556 RepID=A0A845PV01_9FLAO|nr:helicase HerA-like domain-containing protein [Elizabethkingia argenteiflava]NAW50706.1 DUF853 family protein [Elizabethkingia argenteiflava]
MLDRENFIQEITAKYTCGGEKIILGKGIFNGEVLPEVDVYIPLSTVNRHGLIAGATGTGKTKTLQAFVEQLSQYGIPTMVMDIKGDLSGLGAAGENTPKVQERYSKTKLSYQPQAFPVEFMSISDEKGIRLRATVTEFGPVLLSKILGLNDTQSSIMAIIFKYCDDKILPLVDLEDLKKVLQYVAEDAEGKAEFSRNYGSISSASLGAILRSIVALEQQGARAFFGELSFEVEDLLQTRDGKGVVSILRVTDMQSKPQLFSTFMLSLLAEIYMKFPEIGDTAKPKFALFIDEAHLLFSQASKTLLNQIETIVKLIRSKGVGIYFITQVPGDIPEGVLGQLGLKIQHALRGFTAKDKKEIEKAVQNYPITEFYKASELIQNLGIGEAFVTALDEKGIPTPLVDTFLISPESRMDILTPQEIDHLVENSNLVQKYKESVNRESAYEILNARMNSAVVGEGAVSPRGNDKKEAGVFEQVLKSPLAKSVGNTLVREVTNMVFGMLGLKKRR